MKTAQAGKGRGLPVQGEAQLLRSEALDGGLGDPPGLPFTGAAGSILELAAQALARARLGVPLRSSRAIHPGRSATHAK
jgi:hypothetical protein